MIIRILLGVIFLIILFFSLIGCGFWDIHVRKIFLVIFSVILLGGAMNKFTIAFNNGKMPVCRSAVERYHISFVESNRHKLADEGTKFVPLIDRIPGLIPVILLNFWNIKSGGGGICSVGDLFISFGLIALGGLGLIALRERKIEIIFICFVFLSMGISV